MELTTSGGYRIEFIDLHLLLKSELHHEQHAKAIRAKIINDQEWTHPIVIEKDNMLIMDGHHRFDAAFKMGLTRVPCVKLSYSDTRVSLLSWRKEITVEMNDVIDMACNGRLFPPKTTKHVFNPHIGTCSVPLNSLFYC